MNSVSQSEANLHELERISHVGSWVLDLASQSLTWSEETCRIFGRSTQEFTPTRDDYYRALLPADRERVLKTIRDAERNREPYEIDYRIVRPDGSRRHLRERVRIQTDAAGQPVRFLGLVQDLTEWRQLEEQFHHAQRMEVVGLLARGVAHDFNNLLTVVRGRAEMLLADGRLPTEETESLKQIVQAADLAAGLTRHLLAFSRNQPAQLRPLELNGLMNKLTKILRRIIGEDIDVQILPDINLPLVLADEGIIEQILMNLAVNARDAMPAGGNLTITTDTTVVHSTPETRSGKARPGLFVRLTVQDTGPGVRPHAGADLPDQDLAKLPGATPLGLAAVYGLADQLHGWVEETTTADAGTIYRVYLEVAPEAKPGVSVGQPAITLAGGTEKVLLVEDDQALRTFMGLLLSRLGYSVEEAASGPEALEIWNRKNGQFDLLVTDVLMPAGLGGWELARQLRARRSTLKAVVVSGYSAVAGHESAHERWTRALAKPFTPESLARTVRQCLDGAEDKTTGESASASTEAVQKRPEP
jgi:PAS domain S-box-containing protein